MCFLWLDFNIFLKIVQVYPSTTASDDGKAKEFFDEFELILIVKSSVVMGDFNAKFGHGGKAEEVHCKYGIGERNDRDDKMAPMAETNNRSSAIPGSGKKQGGVGFGLRQMQEIKTRSCFSSVNLRTGNSPGHLRSAHFQHRKRPSHAAAENTYNFCSVRHVGTKGR